MLKIKSIHFGNMGRFVGDHNLDFANLPQIFQIDGANYNTGGSSGSGKTTLLRTIDYLFDTCEIPTTILQSRLTDKPMYVKGMFEDSKGNEVTIQRGKSSGLSLQIADKKFTGSIVEVDKKLEELIGIPKNLFKQMYHKRQKKGGFFLSLTPRESYDFIIETIGLSEISKTMGNISEEIKSKENHFLQLTGKRQGLQSYPFNYEEYISKYQDHDTIIGGINYNINRLKASKKEKPKIEPDLKVTKQIKDLEFAINEQEEQRINKISRLEAAKSSFILKRSVIYQNLASSHRLTSQANELVSKIEGIGIGFCHTCKQEWDQWQKEKNNLQSQYDAIVNKLNLLVLEDMSNPEEYDKKIKLIENKINEEKVNNPNIELKKDLFKLREKSIQNSGENITKWAESERQLDIEISDLNKEIWNISNDLANIERQYKNKQENERIQKEILDNNKELKDTEYQIGLSKESLSTLKTYSMTLFRDALEQISQEATNRLSRIPNMSTASIQFESAKETKSGKIKDEITATLSMDGENKVPIKSLSGGEETSVELAIDLAVIGLIENLTGNGVDWLILDESFEGLDSISREQCIELLKNESNKRIIVVDHMNETKESLGSTVKVIREGLYSRIGE